MSDFDFAFSLYGLVLGFTLVEVLAGFVRVMKQRRVVRVGWLTPMLAVFVMLDLISYWTGAWTGRGAFEISYGAFLVALVRTAGYYLAAAHIFPDVLDSSTDLDEHFFANRRMVMGIILALSLASFAISLLFGTRQIGVVQAATLVVYYPMMALVVVARKRWLAMTALAILIADYLFWAVVA